MHAYLHMRVCVCVCLCASAYVFFKLCGMCYVVCSMTLTYISPYTHPPCPRLLSFIHLLFLFLILLSSLILFLYTLSCSPLYVRTGMVQSTVALTKLDISFWCFFTVSVIFINNWFVFVDCLVKLFILIFSLYYSLLTAYSLVISACNIHQCNKFVSFLCITCRTNCNIQ